MTFLPIVERELRVRGRQGATYWLRCAVGTIVALIGVYAVTAYPVRMTPASSGATAFHSLAWLGFLLACSSVLLTSDCISSERREGTLGLLFLTSLHGYDVVLGKLAAVGLSAFYGLLGFMPVLALTFLYGGITADELARTALALLNT